VTVDITGGNNTVDDLVAVINASTVFSAAGTTDGGDAILATNTGGGTLTGGRDAGSTTITVTADTAGAAANGVQVIIDELGASPNDATAVINGSGNIVVSINGTTTKAQIAAAINGLAGYSATSSGTGDANYISANDDATGTAGTLGLGADASGGLTKAAVFELSGLNGSEVFSFGAGTSIDLVADAINLVKDATGVEATVNSTTIELTSTAYGSAALVDIKLISEETGGTIRAAVGNGARDTGTDVVATINGISAKGDGNKVSINTSTLDLSTTVAAGFTGSIAFDITGGGALFQLGPDVVSNQQARIGITSVNTARLGGVSGLLYQLANGGSADLATDATNAAAIVNEAIDQITTLRGRLGAFQRTLLETNKNALSDTLINLTEAESQIRDADFAAESAALTRAQILVQSGTTVLQIANSNPQNVLALLR
jgi:flagellin